MADKEIWAEALNLAKDQLRHGKVHFSELEVVTKSIYEKLETLKNGPEQIVKESTEKEEAALPQHLKTKKAVKCALCGSEFKTLTGRHLASHGMTRKEYMERFHVKKGDMSLTVSRKTSTGENNPLKQMQMIMKEFNIKRGDVSNFIKDRGFEGLKGLVASANEQKINIIDLLRNAEAKEGKGNK